MPIVVAAMVPAWYIHVRGGKGGAIHDPFYFSRAFRRGEGISPTRYRQAKNSAGIP